MPTLFLIRHGENDYLKQGRLPGHTPGIHLNKRGCEQAALLAESLKSLPICAIYSSPLERAVETAEPLAKALSLPIQLKPSLKDTDVGDWEGVLLKKLRKQPEWKQVQEHPSMVTFPGGESFLELQARLFKTIDGICAAHKPKDLLAVVFHSDPIKLVLAHYIGLPLDNIQQLGISAGSVTVLMVDKSGGFLAGMNLKPPFVMGK